MTYSDKEDKSHENYATILSQKVTKTMFYINRKFNLLSWMLFITYLICANATSAQGSPTWCLKVGTADGKYSGTDSEITVIVYNNDISVSRTLNNGTTDDLDSGETDTYYLCKSGSVSCFASDSSNIPSHIGFQNFDNDGWQMEWYQVYMSDSSNCILGAGPAYLHGFYNADGPNNIWLDGDGNQQEFFNTMESGSPIDEHGYIPAFAIGTRQQCYKDSEPVDCIYE